MAAKAFGGRNRSADGLPCPSNCSVPPYHVNIPAPANLCPKEDILPSGLRLVVFRVKTFCELYFLTSIRHHNRECVCVAPSLSTPMVGPKH